MTRRLRDCLSESWGKLLSLDTWFLKAALTTPASIIARCYSAWFHHVIQTVEQQVALALLVAGLLTTAL